MVANASTLKIIVIVQSKGDGAEAPSTPKQRYRAADKPTAVGRAQPIAHDNGD